MHISRREFIVVSATGTVTLASTACGGSNRTPRSEATTRLSVVVSGLVGMVSPNEATHLILLDGEKTGIGKHSARLSVAAGNVAPAGFAPSETQGGRSFWNLANHQLTLMSGDNTGTKKATGLRRPGEEHKPTDTHSHKDVTWVADMSRIPAAGSGRINPQCLEANPTVAKVASRVRFNGGEIAAKFRPPFHQVVFEFGDSDSPNLFKQALAELSLSQTITSDKVIFRLEPFDGSGPAQDIVLAPSPNGDLEVVIENLPSPQHGCKTHEEANTLSHFAAFYQLLAEPPGTAPIPTCRENCPGCPSESEVVYCPPTGYGT